MRYTDRIRWTVTFVAVATLSGCSRSPAQSIFGSYFPSWLLCLVCGVIVAVIVRAVLFAIGIGEYVFAPLIAYPAMALGTTFLIWLGWFAN